MNTPGFQFDNSYAGLPEIFYSRVRPTRVKSPSMLRLNSGLAETMGLDFSSMSPSEAAELLSGNAVPEGADPLAQAYAGHQFGHFTMLGDGRAILMGEHLTPGGIRLDIQFKGSGRTAFSRGGDGRAAVKPMLREYLISEAMHGLGIPTTRSLAVVLTGEPVFRETPLKGAVLTRVAASHLRVGTFQFAAMHGQKDVLEALLDYTLKRHYSELQNADNRALALLEAVMDRFAAMVVNWMRVGFIHGVMNTDNMTLSGETIDYGPCAFMDAYDPSTVFSSIDHRGRYAYGNQPVIAGWNLARFAEALLPLIHSDQDESVRLATEVLERFDAIYQDRWLQMMRRKLGFTGPREGDEDLISRLLHWMHRNGVDYTNTFNRLAGRNVPDAPSWEDEEFQNWKREWQAMLSGDFAGSGNSMEIMKAANPAVIPRNHLVESALEAADNGDIAPFDKLLAILSDPYPTSDRDLPDEFMSPAPAGSGIYRTFCGT